mmetsp:Transcript_33344/g.87404  ORF Transcript_33344/g.87404 Transcript_33344/m.87404 type:complete len:228 (+) Transcript_33344:489-1172(+)
MASRWDFVPYPLCSAKPNCGYSSCNFFINLSRWTFASTEAAEMQGTRPSPSITFSTSLGLHGLSAPSPESPAGRGAALKKLPSLCCFASALAISEALVPRVHCSPLRNSSGGRLQPSTRTQSGRGSSSQTARDMEASEAFRMFVSSISDDETSAMAHATLPFRTGSVSRAKRPSRADSASSLESATSSSSRRTPASPRPAGSTANAPDTTGPARGPRPASSVPATIA